MSQSNLTQDEAGKLANLADRAVVAWRDLVNLKVTREEFQLIQKVSVHDWDALVLFAGNVAGVSIGPDVPSRTIKIVVV